MIKSVILALSLQHQSRVNIKQLIYNIIKLAYTSEETRQDKTRPCVKKTRINQTGSDKTLSTNLFQFVWLSPTQYN